MKYPFKNQDQDLEKYLFDSKETCIIEHEDNWFKEKSHTKLYPNIEEAKAKVAKPYYWILNAIDKYEDENCEDKNTALIELGQLVFKTNYYSYKLTSNSDNVEAKKVLINSLINLGISVDVVSQHMISMDTPKYARLDLNIKKSKELILSWIE